MEKFAEVKALKFGNYRIELFIDGRERPCARLFKIPTVGKNKGKLQKVEGFYFDNTEKRKNYVAKVLENHQKAKAGKLEKQKQVATARAEFKNPYNVGQILYASWGYDQTNIDFYEITAVGNKTVTLCELAQKTVPGSEGFMSEKVTPDAGNFVGETFVRPVKIRVWGGKTNIAVSDKRGRHDLHNYEGGGLYQSHYA